MHLLVLLIIGACLKGAADHARNDYRRSRDQRLKEAAKKAPGGKLTKPERRKALRRHATGWWAGEVFHGFPVARTGLHAGYLAHRTAADHQRHVREEARTTALETRAAFAPAWKDHRKRQAAAQAEILEHLGQAPEGQRTGKEAVRRAAEEVAAKRVKPQRENVTPLQKAKADASKAEADFARASREGNDAAADEAIRRHDEAYERIVGLGGPDVGEEESSAHLRPGEPPCEGCGGSGRNKAGNDACPACRGFGSAPASPLSPIAPDGAICGACGQGSKPGDPVLAAKGGYNIHLSHAKEQQEAYWHALNLMRQQENRPSPDATRDFAKADIREEDQDEWQPGQREGEIDDAVIAADHGYEGEYELAPPPTTTEGAPSVSDTNVKSVTAAAVGFTAQTEGDAIAYAQRRQQAEQHLEEMQAAGVDSETLSDQMDLVDRLRHAEEAVKAVPEQATVVSTGLQKRHGGIDQAVDDSPIDRAAQPTFYGQG